MGAYLFYKTEDEPKDVQHFLMEECALNMKLIDELDEQGIFISDTHDDPFSDFAHGNIKTSGGTSFKFDEAGYDIEDLLEMWTQIFEQLNERFEMKYYARSCSFDKDGNHFSVEQMKRITKNGQLLSGKSSSKDYVVEAYDELYAILSEEEKEVFDISIIKEKDKVLIDGDWREVTVDYSDELRLPYEQGKPYGCIRELADQIKGHKKYVPSIRYGGSYCDVESYIIENGVLIYLELVGRESMAKSITSVLMQGRMKMNDHTVDGTFGYFQINKNGNRRKLISLDDGMAHTILYHSPSIADTNFSVLVGRDKEELFESFSSWMEKSNPIPYPKELTHEIYIKLQEKERLEELRTFNMEACKVDVKLLEEEAADLQDIIIEVCKENSLISKNPKALEVKKKHVLPKSPYLTEKQVQKIYDTLDSMPKTYELEDEDIKPIGLKLFSTNMTLYIVEADKGSPDDAPEDKHTQCFGYVKNEADPMMSEWAYINIPYYLQMQFKHNFIGSGGGSICTGFEQDLYFDDMYIDSKGNVGKKEELEKQVA